MPIHAQIHGTVQDTDSNPIEFANVALYTVPDSALIAGTITNQEGQFTLNANYSSDAFLKVSFVGYETRMVEASKDQLIALSPETTELGELVVNGDLPRIRVRSDALVASVENTVLSKAGTANDVLKRLPAVTGDDGAFEIFGKGAAKIYINNREMRDESELDRISSADIREGEIVYNPGARYDASVSIPYVKWVMASGSTSDPPICRRRIPTCGSNSTSTIGTTAGTSLVPSSTNDMPTCRKASFGRVPT